MSIQSVITGILSQLKRHDKALEEAKRLLVYAPLNGGRASLQTIAAGAISVTRPHVLLRPESGTADNLDSINNFADGKFILLSTALDTDTITVRDYSTSGGNIALRGDTAHILADSEDNILLVYKEALDLWIEVGGLTGGGGGTPDPHAASHQHGGSDEVATATPAANAIPKAGGAGTLAAGWIPAGITPGAHATTHQHGGSDEVATATPAANAIPKAAGTGLLSNGWLDATLASLANLGTVADRLAYTTGVDTWAETPLTSFARSILDDANQAAVQTTLALVPGTNVQAFDAELAAIAGLVSAADRLPYFTGSGAAALATFTAYGRSVAALADAAAGRTLLGVIAGGAGDIWVEKAGDTMTGALDFGGTQFIVNLPDPSSAQHAATKAYVDAVATGLDVKASARVATTANITLSGPQTIDGVSVIAGDRVLVKNQTSGAENGLYVVAAGAWSRAADADASAEVTSGMFTFVTEGTANGNNGYVLTTDDPITLGTTALVFAQFSGAGQIVDGLGLTKTGNTLDVNVDNTTIEINADTLRAKDDGITFAKLQNIATDRLIGRDTAATGDPEEISLGASLEWSGSGSIQRAALTGDVTAAANSNATTIAADAVTLAKMQNIAVDTLLGRATAGTGDIELIALTAAGRALIDDVSASAQRTTLGLGTMAVEAAANYVPVNGVVTGNSVGMSYQLLAVPDIASGQVVTVDVLYSGTGSRGFITNLELECANSGGITVYAFIVASVSWVVSGSAGTGAIRMSRLEYEASGTETVTVTGIAGGFRLSLSGVGATLNRNGLYHRTVGLVGNLVTATVTVT